MASPDVCLVDACCYQNRIKFPGPRRARNRVPRRKCGCPIGRSELWLAQFVEQDWCMDVVIMWGVALRRFPWLQLRSPFVILLQTQPCALTCSCILPLYSTTLTIELLLVSPSHFFKPHMWLLSNIRGPRKLNIQTYLKTNIYNVGSRCQ